MNRKNRKSINQRDTVIIDECQGEKEELIIKERVPIKLMNKLLLIFLWTDLQARVTVAFYLFVFYKFIKKAFLEQMSSNIGNLFLRRVNI